MQDPEGNGFCVELRHQNEPGYSTSDSFVIDDWR